MLKWKFQERPILLIPDKTKPFILETDASEVASGAVLRQYDANGDLKPCRFLSKSFSPTKQQYQIYNRELLAIIHALAAWRPYLLGSPHSVTVWCDHKNLMYFKDPQLLTARQFRWQLTLSLYDLRITHVPGPKLIQADSLSRRPDHYANKFIDERRALLPHQLFIDGVAVSLLDEELQQRIIQAGAKDDTVVTVIKALTGLGVPPIRSSLVEWKDQDGIILYKGRVYVPDDLDLRLVFEGRTVFPVYGTPYPVSGRTVWSQIWYGPTLYPVREKTPYTPYTSRIRGSFAYRPTSASRRPHLQMPIHCTSAAHSMPIWACLDTLSEPEGG